MRPLFAAVLIFLIIPAHAGLKIYYVRHAESGQNAKSAWKDKPKSEWPKYVGDADTFSPHGFEQAAALPDKLKDIHFDFIAVSPKWRTRHTILPYLEKINATAEIWPELEEVRVSPYASGDRGHPPASKDLFYGGKKIELPGDEQKYFTIRPDATSRCEPSDSIDQREVDAAAMAQRAVALIQQRFAGTDKTILVVGHTNAGSNFLHALTASKEKPFTLLNTGLWLAEEQPDGKFKITLANDKPVNGQITTSPAQALPPDARAR